MRPYVGSRGDERLQLGLEIGDYATAVSATVDARWGLDDLQFPTHLVDRIVQLLAEGSVVIRHVIAFFNGWGLAKKVLTEPLAVGASSSDLRMATSGRLLSRAGIDAHVRSRRRADATIRGTSGQLADRPSCGGASTEMAAARAFT